MFSRTIFKPVFHTSTVVSTKGGAGPGRHDEAALLVTGGDIVAPG
jgi:hypothetical protein